MELIKAINRKTGEIRYFANTKELKDAIGKNYKYATQVISRALSKNTIFNGFNGYSLYKVKIDESSIKELK